jgi:quercetin dioxygenase-like cupin family protein
VARPIPDAAPVTTATFPAISIAVLSHRGENAFQFRAYDAPVNEGEAEPRLAFVHVDDVEFTQVVRQLHGDREAGVHIKFLEWTPDRFVAYTRYDPGLVLERHGHSSDHLVFVLDGELTIATEAGDRVCTAGMLVVLEHGAAFGPLTAGPNGVTFLETYTGDVTPVPVDKEGYQRLLEERGIVRLPNPEFERPTSAPASDLGEGDRWS